MADASVPLTAGGALSSSGVGAINGKVSMKPNFSSLPLQMCLFFGFHYAPFFFVLNLCLFTYKAIRYYYPGQLLGWELTTVFLYIFIEEIRLILASKGNKASTLESFVQSVVLAIPLVILHAYYISLQTYVLRVDVVINVIALVFLGIQLLFSSLTMINIFLSSRRF